MRHRLNRAILFFNLVEDNCKTCFKSNLRWHRLGLVSPERALDVLPEWPRLEKDERFCSDRIRKMRWPRRPWFFKTPLRLSAGKPPRTAERSPSAETSHATPKYLLTFSTCRQNWGWVEVSQLHQLQLMCSRGNPDKEDSSLGISSIHPLSFAHLKLEHGVNGSWRKIQMFLSLRTFSGSFLGIPMCSQAR